MMEKRVSLVLKVHKVQVDLEAGREMLDQQDSLVCQVYLVTMDLREAKENQGNLVT